MNFNNLSLQIGSGLFAGQVFDCFGGLILLSIGTAIFYTIASWRFRDTVPVMYLPGKPTTATVDRGLCKWEPLGRMAVLGIMVSGRSLVALSSQNTGE